MASWGWGYFSPNGRISAKNAKISFLRMLHSPLRCPLNINPIRFKNLKTQGCTILGTQCTAEQRFTRMRLYIWWNSSTYLPSDDGSTWRRYVVPSNSSPISSNRRRMWHSYLATSNPSNKRRRRWWRRTELWRKYSTTLWVVDETMGLFSRRSNSW